MGKNGTKIIKLFLKFFFVFLFLQFSYTLVQAQSREVRQSERRYEQQLNQEKKAYEKRRKATLKHRNEIQTQAVRDRMKETEKRSRRYGRKQKQPFCKIFCNKKRPR